jgi:outer membrane immunogenic protein
MDRREACAGRGLARSAWCASVAVWGVFWLAQLDSVAQSADMALKAPPAEEAQSYPAYGWAGCYVGAGMGIASSRSDWVYRNSNPYTSTGNLDPQLIDGADFKDRRGIVGAQVGCNTMVSGPWLVGAELSWMSNPLRQEKNNNFDPAQGQAFVPLETFVTTDIQSVFNLTARLGYAVNDNWLLYVKGGYALGQIQTSGYLTPNFGIFDWSDTRWHNGWTVGAGLEYRLFRNITVGAEYAYTRFEGKDHVGRHEVIDTTLNVPANPVVHGVSADMHTVMARVNFGLSDPVGTLESPQQDPGLPGTWSAFMSTGPHYSAWTGTRGVNVFAPDRGKGYQVYTPTLIGIDYDDSSSMKLETRFKGGHVYARHETAGQQATYNGPIDSEASVTATLQNFETFQPTFGVALNIPTGTSYLPNNQRFARMDPDLVDIGSYGAGFNVNPTAGLVFGLNENTALSVSGGYAWQGSFMREGIDPSAATGFGVFNLKNQIDPGSVFTANANLKTQIDNLALEGSFAYMSETVVKVDGVANGKAGDRYVSNLVAQYQFDPQWALVMSVSHTFQEKNQIPGIFGPLVVERRNSNSHLVIGSVEPSFLITEQLKLAANYSFLYRSDNFYDQINAEFIPAKTKHSVGGSATYTVSPHASIELKGGYSWVRQDTGAFLETSTVPAEVREYLPPQLSYRAWTTSLTANLQF